MGFITIRIKETGQVTEMLPEVARAMIAGGTAEPLETESMAVVPSAEHAVAPAQAGPTKKPGRLPKARD